MHPTDTARTQFAAWRSQVRADWMADDPHFRHLIERGGLSDAIPGIDAFARDCADTIDDLARLTNEDAHLPRLRTWDGQGHRVEQIDFHPDYHRIGRLVYRTGLMCLYAEPGQEMHTLTTMYLLAQNGEAGHACPLACHRRPDQDGAARARRPAGVAGATLRSGLRHALPRIAVPDRGAGGQRRGSQRGGRGAHGRARLVAADRREVVLQRHRRPAHARERAHRRRRSRDPWSARLCRPTHPRWPGETASACGA